MANLQTQHAKGLIPAAVPAGQEVVQMRTTFAMTANPTINDVLELMIIPPGMKVLDWTLDSDAMDSNGTPLATLKVGVLNAGKTDLGTGNSIWKTGITTHRAGGVQRMDTVTALRDGAAAANRVVGIVWTAVSATFVAGTVGLTVYLGAS
jgi:hypothetical protein